MSTTLPITPRLAQLMARANDIALGAGDSYVALAHVKAALKERDDRDGDSVDKAITLLEDIVSLLKQINSKIR